MFNLGVQELMIVFLILMVLFGAKRLPDIGKGLGRGIREFKRATEDADAETPESREVQRERLHLEHGTDAEHPLPPMP